MSLKYLESDDEYEEPECPLCTEILEPDDLNFKPCSCGYQICIWCWHKLNEKGPERCPNCRRTYDQQQLNFVAPSDETQDKLKGDKKAKKRVIKVTSRKQLTNVRVIQRNLVYVVGLTLEVAKEDFLRRNDNFSKFGKLAKVVINKSNLQTATKSPDTTRAPTVSAYITYARPEDAAACIQAIDGTWLDGKLLRASFGTTKYCSYFLRGVECANPDCMYLHDYAAEEDTYNKEDIVLKNGLPVPSKIEKLEEYYPNKNPVEKHVWNFVSQNPNDDEGSHEYYTDDEEDEYEEYEEEPVEKKAPEARAKPTIFQGQQSNSLPSTAQWGSGAPVEPKKPQEWNVENKEEKSQPIQLHFPKTKSETTTQPLNIPNVNMSPTYGNSFNSSFDSFGDSESFSSIDDFDAFGFRSFNSNRKQSRFQFAQNSFGFGSQQQQKQKQQNDHTQDNFSNLLSSVNLNFEEEHEDDFGSNQFSFEDFETASHMNKNNNASSKLLSLLKKQPEQQQQQQQQQAKRSLFQDSQHIQDPAILDFSTDGFQFNGLY
eukprot:gene421-6834_t